MALKLPKVYIPVMGLTGAGKSTFISLATEDESVPIGEGLASGSFSLLRLSTKDTNIK